MKHIKIIISLLSIFFVQNVLSQSDADAQLMLAQIKLLKPNEQNSKLQLTQVLSPPPPAQVQTTPTPVPIVPTAPAAVAVPRLSAVPPTTTVQVPPAPLTPTTAIPPTPPSPPVPTLVGPPGVAVATPQAPPPPVATPTPPVPGMQLQGSLYQNIEIQSEKKTPKFEYPYPEAQPQKTVTDHIVANKAFDAAIQGMLPMSPEQIHRLRQIYDAQQFAAAASANTPPRPTATSVYVNLSPGATPPVIRLADGFVTSMVFLDATGSPWPIEALDIGNPQVFNIQWDKKSNILMIQANTLYTYGNLAIRLRNLNTPVMLTLIPGQEIVDYRVDITVPGYGPEAKALPIDTGLPPTETPLLLQVLDGIPPQGSKALTVMDELGQAWVLGEKMYLRTPYTLLSPGWLATMSSADGTNAYELQRAPMVLMAKNGKMLHVKIEGF